MWQADGAVNRRLMHTGRAPEEINARLFLSLAGFLVWGHQHREVLETEPELLFLVERAAAVLTSAGALDEPAYPAELGSAPK